MDTVSWLNSMAFLDLLIKLVFVSVSVLCTTKACYGVNCTYHSGYMAHLSRVK